MKKWKIIILSDRETVNRPEWKIKGMSKRHAIRNFLWESSNFLYPSYTEEDIFDVVRI